MDFECLKFKAFTGSEISGFVSLWRIKDKYEVLLIRRTKNRKAEEKVWKTFDDCDEAKKYFEMKVLEFQILGEL